ncbi:uncharacterized protein RMCT_1388 [Mycolicibacterium thermoresistibile]|uniref:Uncharacterized protein n=1 Tax=Mycolicibacterium thermoresistibile TaxID=1797 RepID=A0A100XDB1_MYCTH|nr:uncharacterized protein RMCT_1388 [Mycolicibacterium thermoresistibile]
MPPFTSHWHPTEVVAVLTSPLIWVTSMIVSSLIPPHCGKNGPWVTSPPPSPGCWASGDDDGSELSHAASTDTAAAASTARVLTEEDLTCRRTAELLRFTSCTVAAAGPANYRHTG